MKIGKIMAVIIAFMIPFTAWSAQVLKYPHKPIKIIIPAGAGGSLGQEIRAISPALEKQLGVPLVIEYVSGAEGMIAYNKFYKEKSDGYCILCFNLASAISLELTRETAKYRVKDLTPIAVHNVKNFVLVVHPDKWKTFGEFLQEAKQRNISLAATGGAADLQGRLFESGAGIKFNWVPYPSAAEGMAAVAGKHVEAMLTFALTPRPMILAGRLRALAVFTTKPDPILPGVPDFKSLGHEEIPLLLVYGVFFTPPQTPPALVKVLDRAVRDACLDPEYRKMAEKLGIVIEYKPTEELVKLTQKNYELLNRYKQFIK